MVEAGTRGIFLRSVLVALCMVVGGCASFDRGRDENTLTVDLGYAYPERRSFDNETGDQQHQQLFGGRLGYRYVGRRGRVAGAGISFAHGFLAGAGRENRESDYQLFGLNTQFGWRDKWLGLLAGVAHFVPDLIKDYNNEPFFHHGAYVLGGYALCDVHFSERFFLHLGVVGASSPSMRVGIGVRL